MRLFDSVVQLIDILDDFLTAINALIAICVFICRIFLGRVGGDK